jgi:hypothetical protein
LPNILGPQKENGKKPDLTCFGENNHVGKTVLKK